MNDQDQQQQAPTGTSYIVMREVDEPFEGVWQQVGGGPIVASGERAAKKMARADIRAAQARDGAKHEPLKLVAIPARSFKAETSTPQLTAGGALVSESWSG